MTDSPKYGEGGNAKVISRRFNSRKTDKGRICFRCNKDKGLDEYKGHKSYCAPCVTEYQRNRLAKLKGRKLW